MRSWEMKSQESRRIQESVDFSADVWSKFLFLCWTFAVELRFGPNSSCCFEHSQSSHRDNKKWQSFYHEFVLSKVFSFIFMALITICWLYKRKPSPIVHFHCHRAAKSMSRGRGLSPSKYSKHSVPFMQATTLSGFCSKKETLAQQKKITNAADLESCRDFGPVEIMGNPEGSWVFKCSFSLNGKVLFKCFSEC